MEGRVSSVQSMGAVDGPGLRYVVFLQGCPLRCAYCHNPETWDLTGGTPYTAEDLCKTILRYRPYFGENGGVTVSGGEPLLQPEFVAELFRRLHEHKQLLRLLVTLLRLLAQLRFRKRDDRDLRRGKECVDENKYDQYQNFRQ